jgi:hypothetical protein
MNFGTSELVEYQSLLGELKRRLGLSCIMVYERDELMPYYIIALRHILEILITNDIRHKITTILLIIKALITLQYDIYPTFF